MTIFNKDTDERKTLESEGSKEAVTLLKFMTKASRYAKKCWRIEKIETDSPTAYSYIAQHKPNLPIELIEGAEQ